MTDVIGQRWYPQPDDTIGGWCITLIDRPPSEGGVEVVGFSSEAIVRHVAALHNAWLRYGTVVISNDGTTTNHADE